MFFLEDWAVEERVADGFDDSWSSQDDRGSWQGRISENVSGTEEGGFQGVCNSGLVFRKIVKFNKLVKLNNDVLTLSPIFSLICSG